MSSRATAAIALATVCLALAPLTGCRTEVVVRIASVVFEDGGVERAVDLVASDPEREEPPGPNWIPDDVGLDLAEPDAWSRVERDPQRLRAEGYFPSSAEVPASLVYRTDLGPRADTRGLSVSIRDHGVVRVWELTERYADPIGRGEVERALGALVDMAVDLLLDEMRAFFGGDMDLRRAEVLLREDGRRLGRAALAASRQAPGVGRDEERTLAVGEALTAEGAPPVGDVGDEDRLLALVRSLLAWERDRVAAALSTDERAVSAAEMTFWPGGDDLETDVVEMIARHRDEESFQEEALRAASGLSGYFGAGNSPRLRFEVSARLPGTLLRTNGTPSDDGRSVLWLVRAEDLAGEETVLHAASAALDRRALTRLGARSRLELPELLRLVDLLERRDPHGDLAAALAVALDAASLEPLRDPETLPDTIEEAAGELADLLDPDVEPPPPV